MWAKIKFNVGLKLYCHTIVMSHENVKSIYYANFMHVHMPYFHRTSHIIIFMSIQENLLLKLVLA